MFQLKCQFKCLELGTRKKYGKSPTFGYLKNTPNLPPTPQVWCTGKIADICIKLQCNLCWNQQFVFFVGTRRHPSANPKFGHLTNTLKILPTLPARCEIISAYTHTQLGRNLNRNQIFFVGTRCYPSTSPKFGRQWNTSNAFTILPQPCTCTSTTFIIKFRYDSNRSL